MATRTSSTQNRTKNSGIMTLFRRSMPREMPKIMTARVMMSAAACQPMLPKSPVIWPKYPPMSGWVSKVPVAAAKRYLRNHPKTTV